MGCTPGYNFLLGCTPLISNRKLYGEETTQAGGVSGFEFSFTRLGVTTEFCRGHQFLRGAQGSHYDML